MAAIVMAFQIDSVDPGSGPEDTPVTLDLSGVPDWVDEMFTFVFLGASPARIDSMVVNAGAGSIDTVVPQGAASGQWEVRARDATHNAIALSSQLFDVTPSGGGGGGDTAIVTKMTPTSPTQVRVSVDQVRLNGTNLDLIEKVFIGAKQQTVFNRGGSAMLTFRVPAPAPNIAQQVTVYCLTKDNTRVAVPGMLMLAGRVPT